MKAKRAGTALPAKSSDGEEVPALPVWKAFVVQFTRGTGTFAGRVEHMSSGRRARFASREDLIATLHQMLDQLGENRV
jgi:hypothetical protein